MSASRQLKGFRDGVGQLVHIGDLVGGVRLGQYPVTVGGVVLKVGKRQATVEVRLITDTGDHENRSNVYADRSRPRLGDNVLVYHERLFKVDALFVDEEEIDE